MTIVEFFSRLRAAKIKVNLENEKLKISAPKGALNDELKAQMRDRKDEMIAFLSRAIDDEAGSRPVVQAMPADRPALASFQQQQVWFFQKLYPSNSAYNIPFGLRMEGIFDQAAFDAAITEIRRRHEVLRTCFADQDGSAIQVIQAHAPWVTPTVDISAHSLDHQEQLVKEALHEEALTPFDISCGPLLRLKLLKLSIQPSKFVLVGCVHHIVSDGWSTGLLLREIALLYASFSQGNESPLADLPIQYKDFAYWQRQYLNGELLDNKLAFWTQLLNSAPTVSSFPTDHPRTKNALSSGAKFNFELPQMAGLSLIEFSRQKNLTVFMSALMAFQLTLWRYTRQDDLCIGMPVSGRKLQETQELIGFFVSAAIVRVDLGGNWTVAELAEQVRATVLQVLEHDDVPLNLVLDALKLQHASSHSPIAQIGFQVQNFADNQTAEQQTAMQQQLQDVTQLTIEPLLIEQSDAKFDMIFSMSQQGNSFQGYIEYNAGLYEKNTVEKIFEHFTQIVEWMAEDDTARINLIHLATQVDLKHYYKKHALALFENEGTTQLSGQFEITQLSANQRSLYLDSVIYPHTLRNSVGIWSEIKAPIDVELFTQAIQLISDHHLAMRSSVIACDLHYADDAYLLVPPSRKVQLEQVDFTAINLSSDEIDHYADGQLRRLYDLQSGDALVHQLIKIADAHFVYVFSVHHVFFDGAALGVYIDLLADTYRALCGGEQTSFNNDVFRQYVAEDMSASNLFKSKEYWRNCLQDVEALDFSVSSAFPYAPVYESLPPVLKRQFSANPLSFDEVRLELKWSKKDSALIMDYCRDSAVSPPAYFRALYCVLLNYYCRPQQDFILQEILGGRSPFHGEGIGNYYQIAPTVVDKDLLKSDLDITELYATLKAEMKKHRTAGMISIDQQLNLAPQGRFKAIYNFYNFVKITQWHGESSLSKFGTPMLEQSIQLVAKLEDEEFLIELRYDKSIFHDHDFLKRMMWLSEQVVGGRGRLGELDFILPQDKEVLAALAGPVEQPVDEVNNVHGLLELAAKKHPTNVAVIQGHEKLSYEALNARANSIAHCLIANGVKPGQRIGLCLDRSFDFVSCLYGVLKAGAAYVPIDVSYPKERIAHILNDANVPVLLTQGCMLEQLPAFNGLLLLVDAEDDSEPLSIGSQLNHNPELSVGPESALYYIYTSGSTGLPKGAGVRHSGELNLLHWYVSELSMTSADRNLVISAVGFDLTQKNFFAPIASGGAIVLPSGNDYDIEEIGELIHQQGITILNCAPSMLYPLVENGEDSSFESLKSLRYAVLGGEPIRMSSLFEWLQADSSQCQLVNSYGPTECTDVVAFHIVEKPSLDNAVVPIGKPIANTQLHVLSDELQAMAPGLIGEICVSGVGVGLGYLDRPELNATSFIENPFGEGLLYKVGDLGRVLPDGQLEFIGRKDFQVKLRGLRIELGEIEFSLQKIPGVNDALVLLKDEQLIAYVVTQDEVTLQSFDWRAFLADYLPYYMMPSFMHVLTTWPLTPNGKVDRKALPDSSASEKQSYLAPRTDIEEKLAAIWSEVLQRETIGVNDNFFDLGGHSLLATKIASRVRVVFGKEVEIRSLFETPTVAHLAGLLEKNSQVNLESISTADRAQPIPLSFAQQRVWLIDQLEAGSTAYNLPFSARIRGQFNLDGATKAFSIIQKRHEILRTCFRSEDGVAFQAIQQECDLPLFIQDLSGQLQAEQEKEIKAKLTDNLATSFDLDKAPLYRIDLLKLSDQHHVLAMNMHHSIFDGWSLAVYLREFISLYDALQSNAEPELPDLPIQYADFSVWQKQRLQGDLLENSLEYWRGALHPSSFVLDFPTDFPRQEGLGKAAVLKTVIDKKTLSAFSDLIAREGATLYVGLLTVYSALLNRFTQQHYINIGSPDAARNRQELEGLIGFFVNTIIVPADFVGEPSFKQLLQKLKDSSFESFAHQDIPFEQLVDQLQPKRDLSRSPLFQAFFNLLNIPQQADPVSGFSVESLDATAGPSVAKFDLDLSVQELADDGLSLSLVYNADIFSEVNIKRFLDYFTLLINAVTAKPDIPLQEIPLQKFSTTDDDFGNANSFSGSFSSSGPAQAISLDSVCVCAKSIGEKLVAKDLREGAKVAILCVSYEERLAALLAMDKLTSLMVSYIDCKDTESIASRIANLDADLVLLSADISTDISVLSQPVIRFDGRQLDKVSESPLEPLKAPAIRIRNRSLRPTAIGEVGELVYSVGGNVNGVAGEDTASVEPSVFFEEGTAYKASGLKARFLSADQLQILGPLERSEDLTATVPNTSTGIRQAKSSVAYVAPRTDLESKLEAIWAEVLKLSSIGINDNFFELGGHSLLVTQLRARIRKTLGLDIPLKALFINPSIAELAAIIESTSSAVNGAALAQYQIPKADNGLQAPLSFFQRGLWFNSQLNPTDTSFNMHSHFMLKGPLDVSLLDQAFVAVVERQFSLRTVFVEQDGTPSQIVLPTPDSVLLFSDKSDVALNELDQIISAQIAKGNAFVFDLGQGPLFIAELVGLPDGNNLLSVYLHHIITDGWSQTLLLKEIVTHYVAINAGVSAPLAALPMQYIDFAIWQRQLLDSQEALDSVQWWTDLLQDAPPVLALPIDFPRPPVQTASGAVSRFTIDSETSEKLKQYCVKHQLTPFMALLTVYKICLSIWTKSKDIVVGIPVGNRDREELEDLVGFFVNGLVVRTVFGENDSVADLMQENKQSMLAAFANQDIPIELVFERLKIQPNPAYPPVAQVAFQLLDLADQMNLDQLDVTEFGDLSIAPIKGDQVTSKLDMTMMLSPYDDGYTGLIEYNTDLFKATTMEEFQQVYIRFLQQILAEDDINTQALEPLTQDELFQKLQLDSKQVQRVDPLASVQRDLYLGSLLDPDTTKNSLGFIVEFNLALDLEIFRKTVSYVVNHQTIFRSRLRSSDLPFVPQYYQIIYEAESDFGLDKILSSVDYCGVSIDRETIIKQEERAVYRTYDVSSDDPLVFTKLIQKTEGESIFVMGANHAIVDGIGLRLAGVYFTLVYEAFLKNLPMPLMGDNYYEHIWADRNTVDTTTVLDQWSDIANSIEPLTFILDKSQAEHLAVNQVIQLEHDHWQSVLEFSKQNRINAPLYFKVVYALMVQAWCRAENGFAFYEISSGLTKEMSMTPGVYYQQFPFMFSADNFHAGTPIKDILLNAREFQRGIKRLKNISISSQRRLFGSDALQFMYNYNPFLGDTEFLGEPVVNLGLTPDVDDQIQLLIKELDGNLHLNFHYYKHLFNDYGFLKRLESVSRQLVSGLANVEDIDLLLAGEEKQIDQHAFHSTVDDLATLIVQSIEKHPEKVAVRKAGNTLTYKELDTQSDQLALWLKAQGVAAGDFIAVCFDAGPAYIVSLLAIFKVRAVYVPIDSTYPVQRIAYIIENANATLLLAEACLADKLEGLDSSLNKNLKDSVHFWPELEKSFTQLYAKDFSSIPADAKRHQEDDWFYVIYTSGSTGNPKGAGVYYRNVCNLITWYTKELLQNRACNNLIISSLGFDLTQKNIWGSLASASTIVFADMEHYDDVTIVRTIKDNDVHVINCAPSAFYPLIECCETDSSSQETGSQETSYQDLSSLRTVILGGESIQADFLQQWIGSDECNATLINSYGPTECTDIASFYHVDPIVDIEQNNGDKLIPIGAPNANVNLYVMDSLQRRLPPGVVGELYIGGFGVGAGYLGLADKTDEVFAQHPKYGRIYKVGDLVRQRTDGLLEFVGRVDFQVKLRGLRIELGEVEFALRQLPGVSDAIAGVEDDSLVAYLLRGTDDASADSAVQNHALNSDLEPDQWRLQLQHFLPTYMIPSSFVTVEHWPLTPNGKVDRRALSTFTTEQESKQAYVAPSNDVETQLVALWQEILQKPNIGVRDNFFDLGGHSLMATKAIARIRKIFDIDLNVRVLFDSVTIEKLAQKIEIAQTQGTIKLPPLEAFSSRPDVVPLSYYQQGVWFTDQLVVGGNLFNMPLALRITGDLNESILDSVMQEIVRRHETLRTAFLVDAEGVPRQKILPQSEFDLSSEQLPDRPEEKTARIEALLQEKIKAGFDLERGPLLRMHHAKGEHNEHYLFACMHHIISDAWSLSVLMREVAVLYIAYSNKRPSPLPELPLQYADYALWQQSWMEGELLKQQLDYWLEKLHGVPNLLALPTDRPRPEVPTRVGGSYGFTVPASLLAQIVSFSRQHQVTPFITLLMSFQLLLSRYANQLDVCVAVPVAGRNHEAVEQLIGYFINTVVMRTDLSGNPTVEQLLLRVKETAMGGFAHQEVPVEMVLDGVGVDRASNYTPVTQVAFQLLNQQNEMGVTGDISMGDLVIESIGTGQASAKNDLLVSMALNDSGLSGSASYSAELFDLATIELMMTHWLELTQAMMNDVSMPIDAIDLLPAEQRLAGCGLDPKKWQAAWPLTAMQKDQYMDSLVNPASLQNSHGWAIHIHRELDVDLWRQCLTQYYCAQPVLRSRFVACELPYADVAYQAAAAVDESESTLPFDYRDLSKEEPSDEAILGITNSLIYRPYDVAKDPLLQFYVLKVKQNHFVLVTAVHHGLLDGGALNALWVQVTTLYERIVGGEDMADAIALIPDFHNTNFPDYIAYDRQTMDSLDTRLFWQEKLSRVEALDFSLPEPILPAGPFRTKTKLLSDEHWLQIKKFCRQQKITPALYFKCLYGLAIKAYCSPNEDFCIQETMGGRTKAYESTQGVFIQEIPFVFNKDVVQATRSFEDLLAWAKTFQKSIKAHRDISIGTQVELKPRGRIGFMFNFYQFLSDKSFLGEAINPEGTPSDPAGNVQFVVTVVGSRLKLDLFYHQNLFDDYGFLDRLESLSQQIVEDKVQALGQLQWVTNEAEKSLLLTNLAGVQRPYDLSACLHQHFERQVECNPQQLAVVFNQQRLTYEQLNIQANQLAQMLLLEGVKLNDLVGVYLQRSADFLVSILAILKCGAAYVPMDAAYPEDRINYMVSDSQVAVLITQTSLWASGKFGDSVKLINVDEHQAYSNLAASNLNLAISPAARAYVIYTSGSTGQPKGAMITHKGALNHIKSECEVLGLVEASDAFIAADGSPPAEGSPSAKGSYSAAASFNFLQTAPVSSDISVWQFLGPVACGGKVVVLDEVTHVEKLCQLVQQEQVSIVELVPVVLQLLMEHVAGQGAATGPKQVVTAAVFKFPSLRWMLATGEAVSVKLVNQWLALYPNIPLVNAYGPTEAADDVIQKIIRQPLVDVSQVPIGKPLTNMAVYILDEQQRLLPRGVVGEICVAGVGVGLGYWQKPEKTLESFVDNPYPFVDAASLYRTGDLGRWLPNGDMECLGRLDDQVKVRGFRIELGEIEACVSAFAAVKEACVIVRDDVDVEPCLVAYFTQFRPVQEDELRAWIGDYLPDYMVPSHFMMIDQLPLTPAGKVDKKRLPLPSKSAQLIVEPRNETEALLRSAWEEVLNVKPISVTDNFFQIGGHSILAVRLMARIKTLLDVDLPLAVLFQASSIAELSQHILTTRQSGGDADNWRYVVPLRASKQADKNLFFIHAVSGEVMAYLQLALSMPSEFNLYGVQAIGLLEGQEPTLDFSDMIKVYVSEIRSLQPVGPYYLCGQSLGGILAMEISLELEALGETVASIHLLDTYLPDNMQKKDLSDVELLQSFVGEKTLPTKSFEGLSTDELIDKAVSLAVQFKLLPDASEQLGKERLVRMIKVARANHYAVRNCGLSGLAKSAIYHYSAEQGVSWGHASDGWAELGDNISFQSVPGNHESILQLPQVTRLSEKMQINLGLKPKLSN